MVLTRNFPVNLTTIVARFIHQHVCIVCLCQLTCWENWKECSSFIFFKYSFQFYVYRYSTCVCICSVCLHRTLHLYYQTSMTLPSVRQLNINFTPKTIHFNASAYSLLTLITRKHSRRRKQANRQASERNEKVHFICEKLFVLCNFHYYYPNPCMHCMRCSAVFLLSSSRHTAYRVFSLTCIYLIQTEHIFIIILLCSLFFFCFFFLYANNYSSHSACNKKNF